MPEEIYFNLEHLGAVDLQTSTNPKWVQNKYCKFHLLQEEEVQEETEAKTEEEEAPKPKPRRKKKKGTGKV